MESKVYKLYTSRIPATSRTRVLWVSRHRPLPNQILELERRYGPVEIFKTNCKIPNARFVADLATEVGAPVVVAILPLSFVMELAKLAQERGFTLLIPRMRPVYESPRQDDAVRVMQEDLRRRVVTKHADGMYRVLEFEGYTVVREVRIVGEPL
jgi:hypothetical protein